MVICVCVLQSAYILFYMAIVGHALSIASLLISLAIFFYFRYKLRQLVSSAFWSLWG